jgi:hypothetical protein
MGKDVEVIWVKRTPEYFYEKGWTGDSVICPSGQREPTFRNVFSLSHHDQATGRELRNKQQRQDFKSQEGPPVKGPIQLRHSHGEEARCAEPEVAPAQAFQPVMT